ncbi:MAG TPA: hypothetical protein VJ574_08590, partial [Candidatus Bathyarchaeia archaeon]|nr:hypothetical protein [Candidatus Bathyarchaeia archaeon]
MTEKNNTVTDERVSKEEKKPVVRPPVLSQTARELIIRGGPLIALFLLAAYLSIASPYFLRV